MSSSIRTNPSETGAKGDTPVPNPLFTATHWSVVLQAGRSHTTHARAAVETLCRSYWHPLYVYVRRRGHSPEDAQDLTQEFFARLLERQGIAAACPDRGRFRSFLLASMNHFLSDEWDKARAQKRGGGRVMGVDMQAAEERLPLPADGLTPERAFDRRWAVQLLEAVYQRLAEEYRNSAKTLLFEGLRSTLAGDYAHLPYAQLASQLGMSEAAIKVAAHRLRHRYRELLRETIAETVAGPDEVDDELRYLLEVMSSP